MTPRRTTYRTPLLASVTAICMAAALTAETRIDPPKNKYSPADDVKVGREAAQQARQELPLLRDDFVSGYVEDLGRRLVRAIPPRFDYPDFQYTFTTVNVKEINAFALPGGPMFVNRGMIDAAQTEGEVAGVMAHELAHVLLRHGTAQATKAQGFQIGAIAGAIAGAIIGGNAGAIISEGSRFGLGTYFLKYGREYERQADLLGAQLMAQAGYDPNSLARMFETIARQGGSGGPEWLSDHPNPGNRTEYIRQEARSLRVVNAVTNTAQFDRAQARLRQLAPAPSSAAAARRTSTRRDDEGGGSVGPISHRVPLPSTRYRAVNGGDIFQATVPENWREISSNNSMKYVPDGAYGRMGNQTVFTHGVEFGLMSNARTDLRAATDRLLDNFAQGNPQLRLQGSPSNRRVSGRQSIMTPLSNVSEATGERESIMVTTTLLNDGNLFYCLEIAPEREASQYRTAFSRVLQSLDLRR